MLALYCFNVFEKASLAKLAATSGSSKSYPLLLRNQATPEATLHPAQPFLFPRYSQLRSRRLSPYYIVFPRHKIGKEFRPPRQQKLINLITDYIREFSRESAAPNARRIHSTVSTNLPQTFNFIFSLKIFLCDIIGVQFIQSDKCDVIMLLMNLSSFT